MHWILPTTHVLCMETCWGGHRWEFPLHAGSPSRDRQPSSEPESHLPGVTQGNPHHPGFSPGWSPFLSCACFFRLKWLPKEAFHCVAGLPAHVLLGMPSTGPGTFLSSWSHTSCGAVTYAAPICCSVTVSSLAPSESAWDPRMGVGMRMVAIVSPS